MNKKLMKQAKKREDKLFKLAKKEAKHELKAIDVMELDISAVKMGIGICSWFAGGVTLFIGVIATICSPFAGTPTDFFYALGADAGGLVMLYPTSGRYALAKYYGKRIDSYKEKIARDLRQDDKGIRSIKKEKEKKLIEERAKRRVQPKSNDWVDNARYNFYDSNLILDDIK